MCLLRTAEWPSEGLGWDLNGPGQTEEESKEIFKLRLKYREYSEQSTITSSPYTVVIRDVDKRRFFNQDLQPLASLFFFQEPLAFEGMYPKVCDQVW